MLRERMDCAGRDVDGLELIPFCDLHVDHAKLDRLEALGASEVAIDVPVGEHDGIARALDHVAELAAARR